MKKYFAMLLTALLLASGGALAEGNSDVEELTFEMFYTEYGLPYEGEWICLDDAVYFYAPVELPQAEITDELQADGVLASYLDADEQGANLRIVISREGNRDSVDTIAEELQAHCAKVIFVTINDLPAVMGTSTTKFEGDFEIYAEVLTSDQVSYRMQMSFTDVDEDTDETLSLYAFGILISFSETPLEIDLTKVNTLDKWLENGPEATPEPMSSVITMEFSFHDRDERDIEQINRMLAVMDLTDVDIDAFDGYVAVTRHTENEVVVDTTYRYGFDSCTLVCEKAESGQTHRYQIATEVFENANAVESEKYAEQWRETYPERKLRRVMALGFDEHTVFIVVYFEENAEAESTPVQAL